MASLDFSDSYFFASAFFSSARAAVVKRTGPTAGAAPAASGRSTSPHMADEAPDVDTGQSPCRQAWPERVNTYIGCFKEGTGFVVVGCTGSSCSMRAFSICCSVAKSCPTLFDLMDCSMPSSPVLHSLPEFAHIHVH